MVRRTIAAAVFAVLALPGIAAAQGSAPAPAQRTVQASGVAQVLVKAPARLTESTIQAAVDAADRAAEAKAVRVASARATSYAAATGLTLGPLLSVDEGDLGIFGAALSFEEDGGDDGGGLSPYCRPRERLDRRRRRTVTRTECRVPATRTSIIRLTYTVAG